jgi:hypothetical protein
VDRIDAAKGRVQALKAELRSPAAEFPCMNCRYFEIHCTHPAASQISVSPVTGKPKLKHFDAEKMRAEDGPCGPEGALFDSRSVPGLLFVSVLTSKWTWWAALFAAAAGVDSLLR